MKHELRQRRIDVSLPGLWRFISSTQTGRRNALGVVLLAAALGTVLGLLEAPERGSTIALVVFVVLAVPIVLQPSWMLLVLVALMVVGLVIAIIAITAHFWLFVAVGLLAVLGNALTLSSLLIRRRRLGSDSPGSPASLKGR